MRLTKICATIGPATAAESELRALVDAGMDIARLNFSHGEVAEHARVVRRLRRAAGAAGRPVAILQDLQGPRIRVGDLPAGSVRLLRGRTVRVCAGSRGTAAADGSVLPVSYAGLARDVRAGERLLLKDGAVELRVGRVRTGELVCEVIRGGPVTAHCGLNAPDSRLRVPALTARDREHLRAGVAMGVDAIALSFVRDAGDVRRARRLLTDAGSTAKVVAKIERAEAIDNLDSILEESDGVIVARGDLGVECAAESVPLLQKTIIRDAMRARTFVITATQMLESMTHSEMPTRAEVSDVANAILDGTDAVMLSAETAVGRFPAAAVAAMDRIARAVEASARARPAEALRRRRSDATDFTRAVARSAVELADASGAACIVPFTASGRTAALISAERPAVPLFAVTYDARVWNQLQFYRGVHPHTMPMCRTLDELFVKGVRLLRKERLARKGDALVLVGGSALAKASANTLKVLRLGER